MRKVGLLGALALALLLAPLAMTRAGPSPAVEIDVSGVVYKVINGDTVDAFPVGRIRLADINTPERGQPGYAEATNFLKRLIHNKRVYLDVDDLGVKDDYNRLIALAYIRFNFTHLKNVNLALVVNRHATIVDYHNEFDPTKWTLFVHYPEDALPGTYDALLQQYLRLRSEHEKLRDAYSKLESRYEALNKSYSELKAEHERLKAIYHGLKLEHEKLRVIHEELKAEHWKLRDAYSELGAAHEELKSRYKALVESYSELKLEHEKLRDAYSELKSGYKALTEELKAVESAKIFAENALKFCTGALVILLAISLYFAGKLRSRGGS